MSDQHQLSGLLENLSEKEKSLVLSLQKKMGEDKKFLDDVCNFLKKKTADKGREIFELAGCETQIQSCLEYIIIGLTTGEISQSDLEKFLL